MGLPNKKALARGKVPTTGARTVNKQEFEGLQRDAQKTQHMTLAHFVKYMGTENKYHYFMYESPLVNHLYRISEAEYHIKEPMVLTAQREKWKHYTYGNLYIPTGNVQYIYSDEL